MTEPRAATSITSYVCEHKRITIQLRDEAGAIFATATVDGDTFSELIDQVADALETANDVARGFDAQKATLQ